MGDGVVDLLTGVEASEQQAEPSSSDEYDPSQAVQIDFPSRAQDSSFQSFPVDSAVQNDGPNTSTASANQASLSTNVLANGDTLDDRQSLSRSMSRASSESSDEIQINTGVPEQSQGKAQDPVEVGNTGQFSGGNGPDVAQPSSLHSHSGSTLNVSTNAVASNDVPIRNDVQNQSPPHTVQNGTNNTVTNLAAVIPDTGASSHIEATVKPSETLPAPPMSAATPSAKTVPPTPTTSIPRARLPNDTIGILEDRIKEDPRGDVQAWLGLIDEHKKRAKIEDARGAYERFLAVFPSAAEVWVAFAQMENEAGERHAMDTVLSKALPSNPYLPLWSMYLDHIRRHNNLTTDTTGQARQIIHQAYDVALKYTGLDKESGKLWQDYVNFIKTGPGTIGGSGWQDQQKMDLLRKVYQRAICIPHQLTNLLWKEYDGFEMGLNKMTGRKFLQDQSPAYMSARSSYTELQNITRNLRRTTLPVLPPALGFAGDVEYMEQLDIWKRWIHWEKDDPLVLKQDDVASYRARVVFAYKHALMAMRFWPELWYDASDFCFANEMESEGNDFLTQGIAANPESCLLAFKRADRIEQSTANEEGEESSVRRGTALREPYDKVLDALYDLIAKSKTREAQELARIESSFSTSDDLSNGIKVDDDNEGVNQEEVDKEKQKAVQIESVKSMHAIQTTMLSRTLSHVWIALICAMRRIQGKGKVNEPVAGLRGTFADARKRGRITSDVYVTCALLEFHCYEPETGRRIFERGLKLFPEDEAYILEYIKHLVANNDHTNARVVFETAVTKLAQKPETVSKAKPLYVFFHKFESRYGELTQIIKLEKRMKDLYPDDPKLVQFSNRFIQQDFDPTVIRPIVSPATQTKSKVVPSIEIDSKVQGSPPSRSIPIADSPKRPLPTEDSDNEGGRPQKLARTTRDVSPLKGAAGRRLNQQKPNQPNNAAPQFNNNPLPIPPPPPPLPRDVMFLLSIIPKAETYHATKFSPEALVRLIRDTHIPLNVSQLPPAPAPQVGRVQHPPLPQPPVPQYQQPPQIPPMPPGHYNGQFNSGFSQFSSASTPPVYSQIPVQDGMPKLGNGVAQSPGLDYLHSKSPLAQHRYSSPPMSPVNPFPQKGVNGRHLSSDEIDARIAALTRVP